MNRRRVVTAVNAEGKAVFASDEPLAPITVGLIPGGEFHAVWGSDEAPTLPVNGSGVPAPASWFPAPGGFRFAFVTIPGADTPQPDAEFDLMVSLAELEERLPGMAQTLEPDSPGMHTTDTVDYGVILSGSVWLELDDGAERELHPGDCVVQNGTRHAWRNREPEPCVMAVATVGAARDV